MSFTMLLLLAYAVMIAGAFIAFQRRHKAIGIVFLLVMVLSILILGYLWIHSPMFRPFYHNIPLRLRIFLPVNAKEAPPRDAEELLSFSRLILPHHSDDPA